LLDGTAEEANGFLANCTEENARLERVRRLIAGFETPYGVELLASVQWLAVHHTPPVVDLEEAVAGMAAWSERKRKMFQPVHIGIAWNRLIDEGWIGAIGAG